MDNQLFTLTLSTLAIHIHTTHTWFAEQAARQVNTALTIRNWVIGMYIREYEQRGADRAEYGAKLLLNLLKKLQGKGMSGMTDRYLCWCRSFYETYPQIWMTVSSKFQSVDNQGIKYLILLYAEKNAALVTSISPASDVPCNDPDLLVNRLSFSHFLELLKCDTPLQRVFYETECLTYIAKFQRLKQGNTHRKT